MSNEKDGANSRRTVDTGGGPYVQGDLHVNRDFVAGDVNYVTQIYQDSRGLILEVKTIAPTERNRLNYRSRAMPLLGRELEWEILHEFLAAPERFLWQSIHGPGGAGKSRLALEFCLAVADEWYAGFLPENNRFQDKWSGWSPTRPTLIVIDEVERRVDEVKLILQALSLNEPQFNWPVRLLLLGRERAQAIEQLLNIDPFDWEVHFATTEFGSVISLGQLDANHAQAIINKIAGAISWPTDLLTHDPSLRLPLFAELVGLALEDKGEPLRWDRVSVTRYILERNRSRHWTGYRPQDENLLAYLSMVGPQPTKLLTQQPIENLFPTDPETALKQNQLMTGSEQPLLMPLEPASLGELFVLDLLGRAVDAIDVDDRGHLVVAAAFDLSYDVTDFVVRAMTHYPDHPALPRLIAAMVPHFDAMVSSPLGWGVPILTDGILELALNGQNELAHAYLHAIHLLQSRGYLEAEIWGGYGAGAFNLITGLSEAGEFDAAIEALNAFAELASVHADMAEDLGKAFANTIMEAIAYAQDDLALTLIDKVLILAEHNFTIGRYASNGIVSGVRAATSAQEAESIFERCLRLLDHARDDEFYLSSLVQIAFNVANRAQRDGFCDITFRTFETMWTLAEQSADHAISPTFVSRIAIPAGTCIAILHEERQEKLIAQLIHYADEYSFDENIYWNCALALNNAMYGLRNNEPEILSKMLAMHCRILNVHPDWNVDLCLSAALRLLSYDVDGSIRNSVRQRLQEAVPAILDPSYLSQKEIEWDIDLSQLK